SGAAENGGSSICDHGGVFRNESAPLQELLQTESEFRISTNKNQFLPKRSNFPRLGDGANNVELERCLSLPDGPSNYRAKLRGGNLELGPFRKNRSNRLFMNNGSSGATDGVFSYGSHIPQTLGRTHHPLPFIQILQPSPPRRHTPLPT
ncbi:hypothetical protein V8G54_018173, partial [Vigna mungo]